MKPKIFIGSSVEGLNIAYAIQQNLTHSAEVTVWDQGVFELSSTTIESLENILEKSDFGIFVFSPDDLAKIRKDEFSVVRDNVIFEYGLFIGKLGRERVFFVKPMNQDLHLPTDLLGITPGNYESDRQDKSLQAGTGAFCNQVRQVITKLGILQRSADTGKTSEDEKVKTLKNNEWYHDFIDKNYQSAKIKLEKLLEQQTDEKRILDHKGYICQCEIRINEKKGKEVLQRMIKEYPNNPHAYLVAGRVFLWEDYFDKSLEIADLGLDKFKADKSLIMLKADCLELTKSADDSVNYLQEILVVDDVDIALKLINILRNENRNLEALDVTHKIYQEFPNNKDIKFNYARIAQELGEYEIALYLLDSLTKAYPENSSYWGYLSNTCIQLDYYDLALAAKRKAQILTESKEEWIMSNIANIFNNKGFYTEAIEYFEKALEVDNESDYAHERMARAIKNRESERKKIAESIIEGKNNIRSYKIRT